MAIKAQLKSGSLRVAFSHSNDGQETVGQEAGDPVFGDGEYSRPTAGLATKADNATAPKPRTATSAPTMTQRRLRQAHRRHGGLRPRRPRRGGEAGDASRFSAPSRSMPSESAFS